MSNEDDDYLALYRANKYLGGIKEREIEVELNY